VAFVLVTTSLPHLYLFLYHLLCLTLTCFVLSLSAFCYLCLTSLCSVPPSLLWPPFYLNSAISIYVFLLSTDFSVTPLALLCVTLPASVLPSLCRIFCLTSAFCVTVSLSPLPSHSLFSLLHLCVSVLSSLISLPHHLL